jgi:NADH-quinone oxidoreductase subunit J
MTYELMGWWLMAAVAVVCAIGMLSSRNPVHSALWLVGNFMAIAVVFLLLSAPVLFAIQLIVYAGAIMVLFLFVRLRRWMRPALKGQLVLGGLLVIAFLLLLLWGAFGSAFGTVVGDPSGARESLVAAATDDMTGMGNPVPLGNWLFSYHVLPFELTSVLLLIAMIGALMVARDVRSEGRDRLPDTAPVVTPEDAGEEVRA